MARWVWLPWRPLPSGGDCYRHPTARGAVFWLVVARAADGTPIQLQLLRERTYFWRLRVLVACGCLNLQWVSSWYGWISSVSILGVWQQAGLGEPALARLIQLAQARGVARLGVRLPADPLVRGLLTELLSAAGFAVGVVDAWYTLGPAPAGAAADAPG
jgi:hypothetical protein